MTTNFTPGPWAARPQILNVRAAAHVVHVYEDAQGRKCTTYLATCESATADNNANANLIAAAPELYEALQLALKCVEYCRRAHKDIQSESGGVPVEVFIKAALVKAEGGAR